MLIDLKQNTVLQHLPDPRLWRSTSSSTIIDGKLDIPHTSDPGEMDDEICPICLETFGVVDMVRQMCACNHVFHQQCFEDWAIQHQSDCDTCTRNLRCPMCRTVIAKALKAVQLKKPPEAYFSY